jgi:NADH:ubiquinone oxidoreductase subunit 5 (subunit L)/multisubunit Na+/H+ antiporter MnhA subunit
VLVSARELILLFVGFELMSIPLFVLTGFLKRDAAALSARHRRPSSSTACHSSMAQQGIPCSRKFRSRCARARRS